MCQKKIEKTNPAADKPHAPETPGEVDLWLKKFHTENAAEEIDETHADQQGIGPFPPGYAEDLLDLESDTEKE